MKCVSNHLSSLDCMRIAEEPSKFNTCQRSDVLDQIPLQVEWQSFLTRLRSAPLGQSSTSAYLLTGPARLPSLSALRLSDSARLPTASSLLPSVSDGLPSKFAVWKGMSVGLIGVLAPLMSVSPALRRVSDGLPRLLWLFQALISQQGFWPSSIPIPHALVGAATQSTTPLRTRLHLSNHKS